MIERKNGFLGGSGCVANRRADLTARYGRNKPNTTRNDAPALPKRSQHRRPSPERTSDQEKDDGPEHGHDPSRRLSRRVEAQGLSEELTEQCTADTEQGRQDETVRVLPGQNDSCKHSHDGADDDRPEDVHPSLLSTPRARTLPRSEDEEMTGGTERGVSPRDYDVFFRRDRLHLSAGGVTRVVTMTMITIAE